MPRNPDADGDPIAAILRRGDPHADITKIHAAIADLRRRIQQDGGKIDDPAREILARIGDRWTPLIVHFLAAGRLRPTTIQRLVQLIAQQRVSNRVLTVCLRNLERDGFVKRTVFSSVPLTVEYELTPLGRSFFGLVDGVIKWVTEHDAQLRAARLNFDTKSAERTDE